MLSIKRCSELLNNKKDTYSEKEILEIRKLFYELAEMEVENYFRVLNEKKLKHEESNFDDKGQFGRTG